MKSFVANISFHASAKVHANIISTCKSPSIPRKRVRERCRVVECNAIETIDVPRAKEVLIIVRRRVVNRSQIRGRQHRRCTSSYARCKAPKVLQKLFLLTLAVQERAAVVHSANASNVPCVLLPIRLASMSSVLITVHAYGRLELCHHLRIPLLSTDPARMRTWSVGVANPDGHQRRPPGHHTG